MRQLNQRIKPFCPLSLPLAGQPAPPEGEPSGASVPVRQITIFRFGDETHKNRKPSLIFHRLGFLLALFRMTGLDYRGFGVHCLPGGGLFFVLFHPFHLAYSMSGAGEIMRFILFLDKMVNTILSCAYRADRQWR